MCEVVYEFCNDSDSYTAAQCETLRNTCPTTFDSKTNVCSIETNEKIKNGADDEEASAHFVDCLVTRGWGSTKTLASLFKNKAASAESLGWFTDFTCTDLWTVCKQKFNKAHYTGRHWCTAIFTEANVTREAYFSDIIKFVEASQTTYLVAKVNKRLAELKVRIIC